ncbi:hypothetical protein ID866_6410 [Astraeus odoratus]|nr:hypothetical protein ID866_6410 [Astraeus odoratus]
MDASELPTTTLSVSLPSPSSSSVAAPPTSVTSAGSSGAASTSAMASTSADISSTSPSTQSTGSVYTTSMGTQSPTPSLTSMSSSADQFTSVSSLASTTGTGSSYFGTSPVSAPNMSSVTTSSIPTSSFPTVTLSSVSSSDSLWTSSLLVYTSTASTPLPVSTAPPTSTSHAQTTISSTLDAMSMSTSTTFHSTSSTSISPLPSGSSSYATVTSSYTTTIFVSKSILTTITPTTSQTWTPPPTTYTMVSIFSGGVGTTTLTLTSSSVLNTDGGGSVINSQTSPGKIAAVVLGIGGVMVCAAIWLFCARRRRRKLERDAALLGSTRHLAPLEGEVIDGEDLEYVNSSFGSGGPPVMEERYAGILAALHAESGTAGVAASTDGVYGSHVERATSRDGESEGDLARASSTTLPLDALSSGDDRPFIVPLSPPPPAAPSTSRLPTSPPSAYPVRGASLRRKSSPGPDAAAWFGGHSIAPSCTSHYAHSQTPGSCSVSGSINMLTRTHTGSEEPLLGIGRPPEIAPPPNAQIAAQSHGGNRLGLGSAFGSTEGSGHSPSHSYDARSTSMSGSGSFGYTRSGTPSSFDVLRSVSSQGALSSSYSHGHSQGFRFGFGGSASSGSSGKKHRSGFGNPPSSFRVWKDRGSSVRLKDIQGDPKTKEQRLSVASSVSASVSGGSGDERRGRASPVNGVRALLDRLRRTGQSPSPMSSSGGLPATPPRSSRDADVEKTAGMGATGQNVALLAPPPGEAPVTIPPRSYVLSNPDPRPSSLCSDMRDALPPIPSGQRDSPSPGAPLYHPRDPTYLPVAPYARNGSIPSPVPTEELRLPEGLLHPRLQVEGRSVTSLRDFEDYSRPIGGLVKNRMYSTTTFGTVDNSESTPVMEMRDTFPDPMDGESVDVFGTPIDGPSESWFADESPRPRLRTMGS